MWKCTKNARSRHSVFHSKSACLEIAPSAPAGDCSESLLSCGRSGPRVAAHVNVNKVSIAPTLVMILSPRATRALIAKFVNPGITSSQAPGIISSHSRTYLWYNLGKEKEPQPFHNGPNRIKKSQAQTFHNGPRFEIQTVMKQTQTNFRTQFQCAG